MDFYDLLKVAAGNQKNAEKRLPENKRYNLKFSPMKKVSRPKVNQAAIKARLKKKEEEERIQAELEEKKKKEVLALRAEQEAAKSRKKSKTSSSSSSSTAAGNQKRTSQPKKKKRSQNEESKHRSNNDRRERLEESESEDSEIYCSYQPQETEKDIPKAKEKKKTPEVTAKPKAMSFKDLMALASANTNSGKPDNFAAQKSQSSSTSISDDRKPISNNGKVKVKCRNKQSISESTPQSNKPVQRNSAHNNHKTKSNEDVNSTHRQSNCSSQQLSVSGSVKKKKSTLFPSVRNVSDDGDINHTSSDSKLSSTSSMSRKSDHKNSNGRTPLSSSPSVSNNTVRKNKPRVQHSKTKKPEGRKPSPPPKRKGGWLDPVGRTPPDPVAKPEKRRGWLDTEVNIPCGSTSSISKDTKRANIGVKDSPQERPSPKPSERKREEPKAQEKRKEGRLNAGNDSSSKKNLTQSKNKEVSGPSMPSSNKPMKEKLSQSHKEKSRGCLDSIQDSPKERNGGWLGPVRDSVPHPPKRKGGWLGSVQEPELVAKRGRLLSSEDEDSDLDGFIDDTPLEDEGQDVSSFIKQIFNYDKSKYEDESDYALRNMESSYVDMMKEERHSERIGREEDLEDMRKEKEEMKKQKARANRR